MRRLFVPPEAIGEERIVIRGDDVKHIRNVLRMKEGDTVTVTCGRGTDYLCEIETVSEEEIVTRICGENADTSELPVRLILFQALPKSDKMEWIIQKAVELGAASIVPVSCARSVVRLAGDKAEKKVGRWRRIAYEAAKQSGRGMVPTVGEVLSFAEAVKEAGDCETILVPYELSEESGSMKRLGDLIRGGTASIGIFIGPEGGFERHEVESLCEAGGEVISLGKRILRTETAGMTVLSVLMMWIEQYLTENEGPR